MRIIKFFFILLLVATVIGSGVYYVTLHSKNPAFASLLTKVPLLQQLLPRLLSKETRQSIQTSAGNLSQNLPNVSQVSQIGSVLGTNASQSAVQADGESIPQKAFAYTRYTYCKQVVEDYEKREDR